MNSMTRWLISGTAFLTITACAIADAPNYSMADFAKVRKLDAHVHGNVVNPALIEQARADNFELMSINVDYPDFPALKDQRAAALAQLKMDPARFHWATTFSMQGFEDAGWADEVGAGPAAVATPGAKAVKTWKNVGMSERNRAGQIIRIADPGIALAADKVQSLGLTCIAHQGEPHNCWLPLAQMTTDNDREYFKE